MNLKELINEVLTSNLSDSQMIERIRAIVTEEKKEVTSKQIYEAVMTRDDKLVVIKAAYNKSKELERFIRNQKFSWNAAKKAHTRAFASEEKAIEFFNDIEERD